MRKVKVAIPSEKCLRAAGWNDWEYEQRTLASPLGSSGTISVVRLDMCGKSVNVTKSCDRYYFEGTGGFARYFILEHLPKNRNDIAHACGEAL
jgi:hypothetical protein